MQCLNFQEGTYRSWFKLLEFTLALSWSFLSSVSANTKLSESYIHLNVLTEAAFVAFFSVDLCHFFLCRLILQSCSCGFSDSFCRFCSTFSNSTWRKLDMNFISFDKVLPFGCHLYLFFIFLWIVNFPRVLTNLCTFSIIFEIVD